MLEQLSTMRFPGHDEICNIAAAGAQHCDISADYPTDVVAAAKQLKVLAPSSQQSSARNLLNSKLTLCYGLGEACSASSMIVGMHYASWEFLQALEPRGAGQSSALDRLQRGQGLIASITTEFGNNGDVSKAGAMVQELDEVFTFTKEAPICSYLEQAGAAFVLCKFTTDGDTDRYGAALYCSEQLELTRLWDWNAIEMRGTQSHGFSITARSTNDPVLKDPTGSSLRAVLTPASHLFWVATWFGIFDPILKQVMEVVENGKLASPAALQQASARAHIILESRNELFATFKQLIDRYEQLRAERDVFGFRDTVRFNDLKVDVSTRLSSNYWVETESSQWDFCF